MASGCQRQLPRRTRNPKDEQNPAPPPLGGGVSSFWGENKTRPCATIRGRLEGGVGKQHQRSPRPALLEPCEQQLPRATAKRSPRIRSIRLFLRKSTGFLSIKNPTNQVEREPALVKSHRRKVLKGWKLKNKDPVTQKHRHKNVRIKSWT